MALYAFCGADWASDIDDRRSTSGVAIFLGSNLISWWSRKQQVTARSSTEAEYRSLAQTSTELTWIGFEPFYQNYMFIFKLLWFTVIIKVQCP